MPKEDCLARLLCRTPNPQVQTCSGTYERCPGGNGHGGRHHSSWELGTGQAQAGMWRGNWMLPANPPQVAR